MKTFLLIDPATGRGFGSSQTSVPDYEPHAHEIPCTAEQYADPKRWALVDGSLAPVDPAAQAPMGPVITYKADIYRRCTDDEADAIEMALAAASVRKRRLFESALHLNHSDEAFAFARDAMVEMFGPERAGELLAVS